LTGVTVVAVDRDHDLIVLDPSRQTPRMLDDLQAHELADFERNVVMDPTHRDYFTRRLLAALRAIGNPPIAGNQPIVWQVMGLSGRGAHRTAHTPPADL